MAVSRANGSSDDLYLYQWLLYLTKLFILLATLSVYFRLLLSPVKPVAAAFSRTISPESLSLRQEKLSHLRFYFHDIASGPNPTTVPVAWAANRSIATGFGNLIVLDDPLTEGPELGSRPVGRAQGIYAMASQTEVALLMALNFVFTAGKNNGSTLSVLGLNSVFEAVRELPVLGGSGLFQFARGYARARTISFDLKTKDACVEYNVYVFHY
ncbi:hypothetical protein SAY87_026724 [Trapa incisa]|uniref:Dirigent protein n=1 Tax=Trapa incisa TaxID=236973 RepID=A0AAN7JM40_9MYRT|nr:hypothetical protein SAY87_026724 [Trapa incisa]